MSSVFQFIHNDAHGENVLIQGKFITGIIDFGAAEYGEVAKEFSRYIRDFPRHFQHIVATYEQASGHKLSRGRLVSNAFLSGLIDNVRDYMKGGESRSQAKREVTTYHELIDSLYDPPYHIPMTVIDSERGETQHPEFVASSVPGMAELVHRTDQVSADQSASDRRESAIALPTADELYRRFQYTPPGESLEQKSLEVDLSDPVVHDRFYQLADQLLQAFDAEHPTSANNFLRTKTISLGSNLHGEATIVQSEKVTFSGEPVKHRLQLRIIRPMAKESDISNPERIADFFVYLPIDGRLWQLHHRIVADEYRGQGIGSAMLALIEAVVQAESLRRNTSQDLVIDVSQVDPLLFALKRGYRPQTPIDEQRLQAFLYDDGSRFLLGDDDGYRNDRSLRIGFIFERTDALAKELDEYRSGFGSRDVSRSDPQAITTDDIQWLTSQQHFEPRQTEKLAYTINLSKTFEPAAPAPSQAEGVL